MAAPVDPASVTSLDTNDTGLFVYISIVIGKARNWSPTEKVRAIRTVMIVNIIGMRIWTKKRTQLRQV